MANLKVVSISHSIDPDGIGSQAIIFRYFRELKIEPIGFLADYHNFVEVFQQALSENPNVLIISDIGINKSYFYEIIEPLKKLEARKIWIDHHKISKKERTVLLDAIDEFIHDTKYCAAELVQKRFMPNDEISKKIATIGHNGDFDVPDRLSNIFYTLIDYYRQSMKDLVKVREMFAKGDFEDEEFINCYLEAYKVFEAERDRIKNTKKVITIAGLTIAVAESDLLPRGKVTKFLSEIGAQDIYLAIDTTNFRIGLRSDNFDVAALAAKFDGGGHKHRSGFTYKGALDEELNLDEEFLKKIEAALNNP